MSKAMGWMFFQQPPEDGGMSGSLWGVCLSPVGNVHVSDRASTKYSPVLPTPPLPQFHISNCV